MRRSLFNLLTLLSSLLLFFALALWVRAGSYNDAIVLRTAPSYVGRPNLKRVVIRPYKGWVISFQYSFVPRVDAGSPPWRADVPLAFKRLHRPGYGTVPLSDAERRAFEAAASDAYRRERWFRWQVRARGPRPPGPAPMQVMSTWLTAAGVDYYADTFLIDDPEFPGAFHEACVGLPHGIVVAAASCLPAAWLVLWVRQLRAESARRRSGRCPGCGYDLRASRDRCPECGRAFDAATRSVHEQPTESSGTLRPARRRRWELAAFAAVVAVVALVVAWGWDTTAAPVVVAKHWASTSPQQVATSHAESVTAAYGLVRFEAVWPPAKLAVFDVAGPLAETARIVSSDITQVAIDPVAKTVYGISGHGPPCVVDRWGTTPLAGPRRFDRSSGIAFDTRRRRLVIAGGYGFGSSIYTYAVDSGAWSSGVEVGRGSEVVALAYSAEHDCIYAAVAPSHLDPPTLVRLTPQGAAEWRVPLLEPIPEPRPGVSRHSFQLVASGPLLALVRPYDLPGGGPTAQPLLTLIDPDAGRVVYRGSLTPHTLPAPATTAPARAE